jgi:hypothetical protein
MFYLQRDPLQQKNSPILVSWNGIIAVFMDLGMALRSGIEPVSFASHEEAATVASQIRGQCISSEKVEERDGGGRLISAKKKEGSLEGRPTPKIAITVI